MVSRFPESRLGLLDIFQRPTIEKQVKYLFHLLDLEHTTPRSLSLQSGSTSINGVETPSGSDLNETNNAFAIIGMAGRFPGADNVEQYWKLLMEQRDGIATMTDQHLFETYVLNEGEVFVPRYGSINGLKEFNPDAWKMTQDQAQIMDPQVPLFSHVISTTSLTIEFRNLFF